MLHRLPSLFLYKFIRNNTDTSVSCWQYCFVCRKLSIQLTGQKWSSCWVNCIVYCEDHLLLLNIRLPTNHAVFKTDIILSFAFTCLFWEKKRFTICTMVNINFYNITVSACAFWQENILKIPKWRVYCKKGISVVLHWKIKIKTPSFCMSWILWANRQISFYYRNK